MLDRFDMSFSGGYLPWCMVDVDATFLYANSIIVPWLEGRSIGYGWSDSKVTSFSRVQFSIFHLVFFLIICDVIMMQEVFYIGELHVI